MHAWVFLVAPSDLCAGPFEGLLALAVGKTSKITLLIKDYKNVDVPGTIENHLCA